MPEPPERPDPITAYLNRLINRGRSKATVKAYGLDLRQADAALPAGLARATRAQLESYIDELAAAGAKGSTVQRKQASLRGFFDYLNRSELRTDDPTKGLEPPSREERLPVYLQPDQVAQLLGTLTGNSESDRRTAAIILCLYYTGMRAGELRALNVEDILWEERKIRVFGKGRRERLVPMVDELAHVLERWLVIHPRRRIGPLFVSLYSPHKRLGYRGIARVVDQALAAAGLEGFTCHKFRHTFATRAVNRNVSLDKIQRVLGHRRIDTTTIYAHTELGQELREDLSEALRVFG